MRSIIIALFAGVVLCWSPASALADDASKNAKIEEMLQLTHVDRMLSQMLPQMQSVVKAQMAQADLTFEQRQQADAAQQKMMALIADRLSWENGKPAYITIYADTFTEGEIDGILAFYKSPAGHAMLEKMPQLMQKSMEVGQQMMGGIMPEIQQMLEQMKQNHAQSNDKKQ